MSIGSHQSAKMMNDEWLTPPEIIEDLGPFDLDVCAPVNRPWDTAARHLTVEDNGLLHGWNGFVWCNPPYGKHTADWLGRCAVYNNCLVLIFARTETRMWFDYVWFKAHSILFLKGRLHFHDVHGVRAEANAGAPSAIIAYGEEAGSRLSLSDINGRLIYL